jgi:beta-glucosidase
MVFIHLVKRTEPSRENYLKPFKLAIQKGGATGVMTSYNRIGAIWTGGSKALCQGVLRDEWGFAGCIETDYADHHNYMNLDQAIRAGGDLWMDGWNSNGAFTFETSSNTFLQALRNASKHILYMSLSAKYANSIYNESADTSDVILSTKAAPDTRWKIWVGVGDGVSAALLVTWALLVVFLKPKKKAEAA